MRRPSTTERGYGWRWQKYAKDFLRRNPLCAECQRSGRITAANQVDHIVPIRGRDDPLFWPETNHQSLCGDCHKTKTRNDNSLTTRARTEAATVLGG